MDYYKQVLFNNPWRDDDLPSLVYRTSDGSVSGFLGVIPRLMYHRERRIRVAVAHRLMVASGSQASYVAASLVRRFLSGRQDLSISDGANDAGKRIFEAAGAVTSLLYSLNWIRPLRFCRYGMHLLAKKWRPALIAAAVAPACGPLDWALSRFLNGSFMQKDPQGIVSLIDDDSLLDCIDRFSKRRSLRPLYDCTTLRWMLNKLRANRERGDLRGFVIKSQDGTPMGSCLYYVRPDRSAEVLQLAAAGTSTIDIFGHLLRQAFNDGCVCLFGRLQPELAEYLWRHNCILKRGSWALVHAADREIINSIMCGDAFLSGLEAELWLDSPMNSLW
ncbi:MAG: hypothetical protein NTU53_23380 [Planctomycetota bacterium]|nr:hypothetical protein [Planctomycetota bacterium]